MKPSRSSKGIMDMRVPRTELAAGPVETEPVQRPRAYIQRTPKP